MRGIRMGGIAVGLSIIGALWGVTCPASAEDGLAATEVAEVPPIHIGYFQFVAVWSREPRTMSPTDPLHWEAPGVFSSSISSIRIFVLA